MEKSREPNPRSPEKLKLVSPAGDFASLIAAVSNGADSVYLGSKLFNARRLANNFSKEELKKAAQYAHLHGVKVYLALNTLVKNQEISAFLNMVSWAAQYNVDGLILQDLTFAPIIKKYFPQMEIHASTQATIVNSAAVEYWKKYVDVFVLARELSKEEIRQIYENTKARLEIFAHGHLCISYSGQCLISSLIGKRSGNRGMCASSCRKRYNGSKYLLSAKDLCLVNDIKEVIDSGASMIKIEGRMKPAEYVAATTRHYRQQIDAYYNKKSKKISGEEINELKLAFNREFTSGYFKDEKTIIDPTYSSKRGIYLGTVERGYLVLEEGIEKFDGIGIISAGKRNGEFIQKVICSDGRVVDKAGKKEKIKLDMPNFKNGAKVYLMSKQKGRSIIGENKKVGLELSFKVRAGEKVKVGVKVNSGRWLSKEFSFELDGIALLPEKYPLTKEQWHQELKKYTSEIFYLENVDVDTDNSFVMKSSISNLRKLLDDKVLDFLFPESAKKIIETPIFGNIENSKEKISPHCLHVQVYDLKDVKPAIRSGADIIYFDAFSKDLPEVKKITESEKIPLFLFTPMVLHDSDVKKIIVIIKNIRPQGILVNNVGLLDPQIISSLKSSPQLSLVLGYQMNIFNDQQMQFYNIPAIASLELNLEEIKQMRFKGNLIYYAHGTPVVMTIKETIAAHELKDEKGYTFSLRKSAGGNTAVTEMLYSRTIGLLQHTPEVIKAGISNFYLDLREDVPEMVSRYRGLLDGKNVSLKGIKKNLTLGNFKKGVM